MSPTGSYSGLWFAGLVRGVKSVARSRTMAELRCSLRTILCPVDLWRFIEFSELLSAYGGKSPALDAGSPKLAVPLLIRAGCRHVHATDIAGAPLEEFAALLERGESDRVTRVQASACCLPYPNDYFPFVFSVSTIEHIGGDGDALAVAELARVLSRGGRLYLTVPYVSEYHEQWVERDPYGKQVQDSDGRVFFSRYYDWEALQSRILIPSGLRVVSIRAWQEVSDGWYAKYVRRTARGTGLISIITKVFDPVWAAKWLEEVPGDITKMQRHAVAVIILEK